MLECLILGDSIAVGTHMMKPECAMVAKGGINSWQFNKNYSGEFFSNIVIISLGSNDHSGVKTKFELEKLRSRVLAKSRVVWIMPSIKPEIQEIVKQVAKANGDLIISTNKLQPDGIHPSWAGYKELIQKSL